MGRVSSTEKNSAIEGTDHESFIFMRSLQEQEPINGLLRRPWIFIMVERGGAAGGGEGGESSSLVSYLGLPQCTRIRKGYEVRPLTSAIGGW